MKKGLVVILLIFAFYLDICMAQGKGHLKIHDLEALCQLNSDDMETYLLDKGFEPRTTSTRDDCTIYHYDSESFVYAGLSNSFLSLHCKTGYPICSFITPLKKYFSTLKKDFTSDGFIFTGTTPPTGEGSETKIYQKGEHEISTYTYVVGGVTMYAIQYLIGR